jgi:hypothetical protein
MTSGFWLGSVGFHPQLDGHLSSLNIWDTE